MHLIGDYHTHTYYSDGQGSIEDMVKSALRKGLKELAITDHGPANWLFKGEERDFLSFKEEVSSLGKAYPEIRLLMGVEANIMSEEGDLDLSREMIEEMDILLAGLHLNISSSGFGLLYRTKNLLHSHLSSSLFKGIRETNTQAVIKALRRYPIKILTHPGLHMDIDTERVAKTAAKEGTYMEVNSRHKGVGLAYLRSVAKMRASLVVNSDAHHPREVGEVDSLYPLIRRSGLPSSIFVNLEF